MSEPPERVSQQSWVNVALVGTGILATLGVTAIGLFSLLSSHIFLHLPIGLSASLTLIGCSSLLIDGTLFLKSYLENANLPIPSGDSDVALNNPSPTFSVGTAAKLPSCAKTSAIPNDLNLSSIIGIPIPNEIEKMIFDFAKDCSEYYKPLISKMINEGPNKQHTVAYILELIELMPLQKLTEKDVKNIVDYVQQEEYLTSLNPFWDPNDIKCVLERCNHNDKLKIIAKALEILKQQGNQSKYRAYGGIAHLFDDAINCLGQSIAPDQGMRGIVLE